MFMDVMEQMFASSETRIFVHIIVTMVKAIPSMQQKQALRAPTPSFGFFDHQHKPIASKFLEMNQLK